MCRVLDTNLQIRASSSRCAYGTHGVIPTPRKHGPAIFILQDSPSARVEVWHIDNKICIIQQPLDFVPLDLVIYECSSYYTVEPKQDDTVLLYISDWKALTTSVYDISAAVSTTLICYLLPPYSSKPTVSRGSPQCNGIRDTDKNTPPPRPANQDAPLKFLTYGPPIPHTHLLYAIAMPELPGAETRMDALQPIRTQPALDVDGYGMGRPNRPDNLRPALRPRLGHVADDIALPIRR